MAPRPDGKARKGKPSLDTDFRAKETVPGVTTEEGGVNRLLPEAPVARSHRDRPGPGEMIAQSVTPFA